MKLSLTIEQHLERCSILHPCLCPRQVLGIRLARFACEYLGVDPLIERKQLFVYMEMGRCFADAVIVVTGASPTNELMQLMDYGKAAATFVNLQTGQAVRVKEHPTSRQAAIDMMPRNMDAWQAQLQAYQMMPDSLLLCWEEVELLSPIPETPEKHSITCDECHDRINEHREVIIQGKTLCRPCAYGSYYEPGGLVADFLRDGDLLSHQ